MSALRAPHRRPRGCRAPAWLASSLPRSASMWTTRPRGRERVVVRGEFAEPGADDEQYVGVLQELGRVRVLQPGARREPVRLGEGALAAEGGGDGGVQPLCQLEQLSLGSRAYDTAARQDRRAGRRVEQLARPARSVRGGAAGARTAAAGERPGRSAPRWGRAARPAGSPPTPGRRVPPARSPRRRQARTGICEAARTVWTDLTTSRNDACWSREFVQISLAAAAETGRGDLTADAQHGRRRRRGFLERGERHQRAGARRDQQRGDGAGQSGVRVGGEARVVLHPQPT